MRRAKQSFEAGYSLAKAILLPWFKAWFRWHFEGLENIPTSGPAIVASNHLSYFDPLAVAYGVDRSGRRPRFLAKASLFDAPFVGWVLRTAKQIRVDRGTRSAPQSLEHAEKSVADGEVIVIFPEGTTTTAPDLAPLPPKTGVARLALKTGLDVIPCAAWGGQWFWTKHLGKKFAPGKDMWVRFGRPVSLKRWQGHEDDPKAWDEVARYVMDEIAILLAGLKVAKPWQSQMPTRKKFIKAQRQITSTNSDDAKRSA